MALNHHIFKGKSLHVKRLSEDLPRNCATTTVRLLQKNINMEAVVKRLCQGGQLESAKLVHIDLSPAVSSKISSDRIPDNDS